MRGSNTIRIHGWTSGAALGAAVILVGVAAAHASVVSETSEALALYPNGGYGLELAVTRILTADAVNKTPHEVAEEILFAARAANDEQMAAIGRALAARARTLAETDGAESRAILAAVVDARNPALQTSFNTARGHREPGLVVPTGNDGSGFDATSPE